LTARLAGVVLVGAALALVPPDPAEAATRSCRPVENPYPGSRYEDVDLRRIRASGIDCRNARRVVRGAHREALGSAPPPGGVRRFTWRGWRVAGDLRGATDRYVAVRAGQRVRWVF
jgi:hypothetical protein